MSGAVYPPSEKADWPGRRLDWAEAEWDVFVVDDVLGLVSYTGVVLRDADHDGTPVRVGGIGGLKTHPEARGRGHAASGLDRTMGFFRIQDPEIEFGLLVCDDSLLDYYQQFGWRVFTGDLMTMQQGKSLRFDFNRVMVVDIAGVAPLKGTIDLKGPPW